MAVAETQNAYMMDRKRLYVDGHQVKMAVAGLGFEPNVSEVQRSVYGDIDPVQIFRYTGGPQSIDIMDDANLSALRKVLAGFDPTSATTAPIIARVKRTPRPIQAWVVTLDEENTGHDDGSELLTNWRARFGSPQGDPDGEAVRTIQGNADVPKELLDGSQWTAQRVALTSTGSGCVGSWATPAVQELTDIGSGIYAAYLEVQKASGRDFTYAEVEVDSSNVTTSSNGGQVTIAHSDVVNGIGSGATYAWVIFAHAGSSIVTPDSRYGYT